MNGIWNPILYQGVGHARMAWSRADILKHGNVADLGILPLKIVTEPIPAYPIEKVGFYFSLTVIWPLCR